MKTPSIGFVGGGRNTRIFLQAFVNKKHKLETVFVVDTNEAVVN